MLVEFTEMCIVWQFKNKQTTCKQFNVLLIQDTFQNVETRLKGKFPQTTM